jgi:hypothetical protein
MLVHASCLYQQVVAHLLDGKGLLVLIRSLESLPGIFRGDVAHNAVQGEETVGIAIGSDVALGLANAADVRGVVRAVGLAVTGLATATTLAGELALDTLVGAVRGVVAGLVAVIAQPGVVALGPGLGAVAGEVVQSVAAGRRGSVGCQSRVSRACLTCGSLRRWLQHAWTRFGQCSQCRRQNRRRHQWPWPREPRCQQRNHPRRQQL